MKFLNGKPEVLILPEILNKIKKYTRLCEHQIYWMGKVNKYENVYCIEDVMLIPQTVGKNAEMDYIALADMQQLLFEEGYEELCIGRTKKNKGVEMNDKDLEMLKFLTGEVYSIIYIQTNNKDESSVNIVDFDKGIIFDDLELSISDTEFYSDEDILAEIETNISMPSSKTWLSTKDTVKPVEIRETDNKNEPKQMSIVETLKENTKTTVDNLKTEVNKVIEIKKEKPEYQPNQFVKDNIDFRELVMMGGDINDSTT